MTDEDKDDDWAAHFNVEWKTIRRRDWLWLWLYPARVVHDTKCSIYYKYVNGRTYVIKCVLHEG